MAILGGDAGPGYIQICRGRVVYRRAEYPDPPESDGADPAVDLLALTSPSSGEELLQRIRLVSRRRDAWPSVLGFGFLAAGVLAWRVDRSGIALATVFLTLALTWLTAVLDRGRRRLTLFYDLDPGHQQLHLDLCALVRRLGQKGRPALAWAEEAGSLPPFPVLFRILSPPWLRTNIDVPTLSVQNRLLYLLPDRLLILEKDRVEAVDYVRLHLERRRLPEGDILRLHGGDENTYRLLLRRTGDADLLESVLRRLTAAFRPRDDARVIDLPRIRSAS